MQTLKENMSGIIACLVEALVGILLFVNPVGFTSGIIIALGILRDRRKFCVIDRR